MNLKDHHNPNKPVSTFALLNGSVQKAVAIHILKDQELKEHSTPVPAVLICVNGEALYGDEKSFSQTLLSGDMVNIEANVKHWVKGLTECELILLR